MYGMAIVFGVGAILFTPVSLAHGPSVWTVVIVGSMLVFGFACLIGTLLKNYIVEWVSLFFLTAGLSSYVLTVWVSAVESPNKIAGSSMLTMLVLSLAIRLVDLTVYWLKNVKAAKLARDLGNDD